MKTRRTVRYCVVCGSPLPSEKVFVHDGCRGLPTRCAECGQAVTQTVQSISKDVTKSLYCSEHQIGHSKAFRSKNSYARK